MSAISPATHTPATAPESIADGQIRIARIIGRLNIGGPSIQAITLTRELESHGYRTLLIRGSEAPAEGSMDYLAEALGVRPLLIPALKRDPGWHDLSALSSITSTLLREHPDIVHTHAAKAGTLGRVASLIAGGLRGSHPVRIHTFHGHSLTGYFSPRASSVYRMIERLLARRTDRLIAVSEQVRDELVALGVAPVEQFVVVPLGFDLARFTVDDCERSRIRAAVRSELRIGAGEHVVTIIARLVPIKRVDRFLRACVGLMNLPDVRCLVVGDGELRDALMATVEARTLGDRLIWTGFRQDIPGICFASDVVALTSDNEGTPVSLIEASAAGVPTVSTTVGGAARVIRNGETGILVPVDDHVALHRALERLLLDSDLRERMGAVGRAHAVETFSLSRLVDDLDRLYRELLATKTPTTR